MPAQFVSEAIEPRGGFSPETISQGEPALPPAFVWREQELTVASLLRSWRSHKSDRGDVYVKRHWFEITLEDGRRAVVYFDRQARRGAARWWLYTLAD